MDKIRINLYKFIRCLSGALDLVSPKLNNHHQQVAYLSFCLAEQLKLDSFRQKNIIFAALVHDIGVISEIEKMEIIETEPMDINNHAFKGAKLLDGFEPLQIESNIIKFHHLPWNNGEGSKFKGEEVLLESHIVHLADRTCARLQLAQNVLSQVPVVLSSIYEEKDQIFEPGLVDALKEISKKEYIWLDLISRSPIDRIPEIGMFDILALEIDEVVDLAAVFSSIIDFRSRYTARHSAGVAKTAERLAELCGFSPYERKMMLIAGYLHDLGKLAVDNEVLEKPSKLTDKEFNQIRSHTYYTFHLLEAIPQFQTINRWASYHHEKLNGNGYPFHIKGDNLSLGSRIMAVADIFTAITEDRPYRKGMEFLQAANVLNNMVARNEIDGKIVRVLIDNFKMINDFRELAQKEVSERYDDFMLTV